MTEFLAGRKALVTGASKGIGLAIADALLSAGADVVICGRDSKQLNAAVVKLTGRAHKGKVAAFAADVSKSGEVERLFQFADQQLGVLDILINNAGFGTFRATSELGVQEWDSVIATNLSGAFYCSREALQRFERRKSGFIINMSSLAGRNPFAGGAAYNASKFGLNGFSEAMMLDHRHDNVRVSYIMPGSVDTAFADGSPGSDWKIAPEDIAQIVMDILQMPSRTLISRVEVRPSRPRKD